MFLASLSSLSLALMIIFDKLMIKDCYEGNVRHALFVSSFFGSVFGLTATAVLWIFFDTPVSEHVSVFIENLFPYGMLLMIAGALAAQVLYHYFICFSEEADTTVMASWIAATPIFVFIGMWFLGLLSVQFATISFSPLQIFAVFITSISLALLERYSYKEVGLINKYRIHLALMLLCNIVYILIIDQTLAFAASKNQLAESTIVTSLLPLYWLGFASGMAILIRHKDRSSLAKNNRIVHLIVPILIAELLGMFVFFFEFLGLGVSDSVTVSLIISLHVLPVWLLSQLLTRLGRKIDNENRELTIANYVVNTTTLEDFETKTKNVYLQLVLVMATLIGLALFFGL